MRSTLAASAFLLALSFVAGCGGDEGSSGTTAGGAEPASLAGVPWKLVSRFAPPAATKKACADPDGVMEQEAAYLAALPSATQFRVDGGALALLAADGTYVASYVPAGTTPSVTFQSWHRGADGYHASNEHVERMCP
jgi:hypothetical protein